MTVNEMIDIAWLSCQIMEKVLIVFADVGILLVIRLKMHTIHDLNDGLVLEGDNLVLRGDEGRTMHVATANVWQHFRRQRSKKQSHENS